MLLALSIVSYTLLQMTSDMIESYEGNPANDFLTACPTDRVKTRSRLSDQSYPADDPYMYGYGRFPAVPALGTGRRQRHPFGKID